MLTKLHHRGVLVRSIALSLLLPFQSYGAAENPEAQKRILQMVELMIQQEKDNMK